MASEKIEKYGLLWDRYLDSVHIEMHCIQQGGEWDHKGVRVGRGLFHHYKELQKLLWPEEDHHRWSDLMLEEILKNRITAIIGPKDSGKTHCALAKFSLTDYFCFPHETLVLISSTDLRGLELRVWGDLKSLFQKAKERYSFLSGHLIDSKHAISTQNIKDGEVRDMRRGIVCIPCMSSGGSWIGLGKYVGIKQKRRRLLSDECFPAGTLVDTPHGSIPIEQINPRDVVISAIGPMRVIATQSRMTEKLVRITTKDNREIICTLNHLLFTNRGWVKAIDLKVGQYMISAHESLQILRQGDGQSGVLQSALQWEVDYDYARRPGWILHQRAWQEDQCCKISHASGTTRISGAIAAKTIDQQLYEEAFCKGQGFSDAQGNALGSEKAWWEWNWSNYGGKYFIKDVPRSDKQFFCANVYETEQWLSNSLSNRRSFSKFYDCCGSRWTEPQSTIKKESGFEKDSISGGDWVARVEILQSTSFQQYGGDQTGVRVYNLQVEGHPSYSVNGFLVHNCQFMRPSFLESLANLNSGDFKGVFVGNPIGENDPLDKIAEPKDGWGTEGEFETTTTWDNKFVEGRTINLVGTDSPNFEYAEVDEPRFPYLIHQKSIDNVVAFYGKDSLQYWSQCKGKRRVGLDARRVITKRLCYKFHAFEPVIWRDNNRIRIYSVDAAYGGTGGDRCVGGMSEFGKDINNKIVLNVHEPVIIPVSVAIDKLPEDQIAEYVKADCERLNVPANHVFYDATGRGSLGTSFARVWSAYVNPVEFGGKPTERPVSANLMIYDESEKRQRFKRCDEQYSKFVTELWWSVRLVIESDQMRGLPEHVADEGCAREWKMVKGDKIEIESKADMKERVGYSPDKFDWLVTCIEGARRLGFVINKLAAQEQVEVDTRWKTQMKERARQIRRQYTLDYAA